jgi:hypothetical protein
MSVKVVPSISSYAVNSGASTGSKSNTGLLLPVSTETVPAGERMEIELQPLRPGGRQHERLAFQRMQSER